MKTLTGEEKEKELEKEYLLKCLIKIQSQLTILSSK